VILAVAKEDVGLLALGIAPGSAGEDQADGGNAWRDHAGAELASKHGKETSVGRGGFVYLLPE
jgi:hypothetical protein